MGASSGSALAWPGVTVGDPERHRTIDQGIDEGLVLATPREVIDAGTVNEIPWSIQGYVTVPGPSEMVARLRSFGVRPRRAPPPRADQLEPRNNRPRMEGVTYMIR
jgi:hypothetical protein